MIEKQQFRCPAVMATGETCLCVNGAGSVTFTPEGKRRKILHNSQRHTDGNMLMGGEQAHRRVF